MKPAIVVVGYNRPDSLDRLLQSVGNAQYQDNDIPLVISLDKAKNEKDVIEVAEAFKWTHGKKTIRTFEERQGLRRHIIQCGDLSQTYGAVIILEDDLFVSPGFYLYTQRALDFYENEESITGVSLYSHGWNGFADKGFSPLCNGYDNYLGQFSISWGQCWTYKWWSEFKKYYLEKENKLVRDIDIPEQIDHYSDQSWGKYFAHYIVESNKFYVVPYVSLSTNYCEVGQHNSSFTNSFQVNLLCGYKESYVFAPVDKAVKYDIYCENMELSNYLPLEIQNEGIVIDLFGYGRRNDKKRYILSTALMPFKVVKQYGLNLRPFELNIIHDVNGRDIFLYDTKKSDREPSNNVFNVVGYDVKGVTLRKLLPYVRKLVSIVVKQRVYGLKKEIKK